jgi:hypothetical protein
MRRLIRRLYKEVKAFPKAIERLRRGNAKQQKMVSLALAPSRLLGSYSWRH